MIENYPKDKRPLWDDYFLELADAASKRATCNRGRSGCVIVRDKQPAKMLGFVTGNFQS